MLNRKTILRTKSAAAGFVNFDNIALMPLQTTPLYRLTKCCVTGREMDADEIADSIQHLSSRSTDNVFLAHTAIMEGVKSEVLASIKATLKTANTAISPIIEDILGSVQKELDILSDNFGSDISIAQIRPDALLLTQGLSILLPRPDVLNVSAPASFKAFDEFTDALSDEELAQLLRTGLEDVDSALVPHLKEPYALTHESKGNNPLDKYTNCCYAIRGLICVGLQNGNLGSKSLPGNVVRENLLYATSRLAQQMDTLLTYKERGRLVISIQDNTVNLDAGGYRAFLKAGGTIESIMGYGHEVSSLSGGISSHELEKLSKDLIERPEEYVKIYARSLRTKRAAAHVQQARVVSKTVQSSLFDLLKERGVKTSDIDLNSWFLDNPYTTNQELDGYVLNAVLDTLKLEGTQVGRFIRYKREYAKTQPDASAKDITATALMRILAEAIATQITYSAIPSDTRPVTVNLSSFYEDK